MSVYICIYIHTCTDRHTYINLSWKTFSLQTPTGTQGQPTLVWGLLDGTQSQMCTINFNSDLRVKNMKDSSSVLSRSKCQTVRESRYKVSLIQWEELSPEFYPKIILLFSSSPRWVGTVDTDLPICPRSDDALGKHHSGGHGHPMHGVVSGLLLI